MDTRAGLVRRATLLATVISLLAACDTEDELVSTVSDFGGAGGAGGSQSETADSLEEEDEKPLRVSLADCLEGIWDVDKDSYVLLFAEGVLPVATDLSVTGDATVEFRGNTYTSTYQDWLVSGTSPEGDMTVLMEGTESGQWELSEDGNISTDAQETAITSTLTVSMGGQQMVLPMAEEEQRGLDLTNLATACEADTMTLTGPEGFLVLNRR